MRKLVLPMLLTASMLVACANANTPGDAGSDPLVRAIRDASARTLAAGSAHMRFDLSVESGSTSTHLGGDADVAFGGDDPTEVEADVRLELPTTAGAEPGSTEIIVDAGPVLYVRSPFLAGFLDATTPWIKIDPRALPGGSTQLGALTGGQSDPAGSLGLLYGVTDVRDLGLGTVDGVQATHYRATVDLGRALREIPAAQRASLQRALDALRRRLGGDGPAVFPIDVWVDGDGYLKQIAYSFDVPADETNGGRTTTMTLTLSNVGRRVDVQPPPADRVTDIVDLIPQPTPGG